MRRESPSGATRARVSANVTVVRSVEDRIDELRELYASAWWARVRTPEEVGAMLRHTPIQLGLVDTPTNHLIAFCRVLGDGVFVATILDVIVHPRRRGEGLGERLMDEVLAIAEVAHARSIELVCQPDLIPFYRRWGFTEQVGGSTLMRKRGRAG